MVQGILPNLEPDLQFRFGSVRTWFEPPEHGNFFSRVYFSCINSEKTYTYIIYSIYKREVILVLVFALLVTLGDLHPMPKLSRGL